MRRYMLLMMLVISAASLALVGCSKAEDIDTVPVEVMEETRDSIEVFGVVKSNDVQSINVDIELKVTQLISTTGDQVSKGDRILKFDKELVEQELIIYKQELELIAKRMGKSDITTLQLKNSLSEASDSLKIAEEKYIKDKSLYDSGIKTKAELDESREAYNQLLSRIKDLKLSIENEAINNTFTNEESTLEYNRLAQKIDKIESILNNKNLIDGDYFISHIESGVVTELNLLPGEYIVPKNNIYKLVDNSDLYIEAEVSEEFIKDITIGQEIEITPLFDKSKTIMGTVEKINGIPYVKNGETIVPIEISIEDTEGFMPNFNVDVVIYLD